jgi:hypothetical protein
MYEQPYPIGSDLATIFALVIGACGSRRIPPSNEQEERSALAHSVLPHEFSNRWLASIVDGLIFGGAAFALPVVIFAIRSGTSVAVLGRTFLLGIAFFALANLLSRLWHGFPYVFLACFSSLARLTNAWLGKWILNG